jgi:hypothetical protein
MNSSRIRITPIISAVALALALLVAAPVASASSATAGPAMAEAAKKGKKKKKKRKKARPAPAAPTVPGGPGTTDPPGPPGPPGPKVCEGEDSREPNDDLAAASALAFPGTWDAIPLHVCPGDADFFKVELPAGKWFRATVDPADGLNLLIRLYGPAGELLYTANLGGPGAYEELAFSNSGSASAAYSVEVSATDATQGDDYDLYAYEF